MGNLALTAIVIGAATLIVPHLEPKDNRARIAVFGACVLLTSRYIVWRFAASLPPLALRPESLYAWTFATVEALAAIGWALNFITLMRTGSRSAEASANRGWLDGLRRPPRVDVLITT